MDSDDLGGALRAARLERDVGLRQLARRAELSPASLSAIENGQTSPTLATLNKILKALGTDLSAFFAGASEPIETPVFRRQEMHTAADEAREYTFLFPRRAELRFEMVRETIAAGEKDCEWETHDCDVGGVILSGGPAQLQIDGVGEWDLRQGDAFYVKAKTKHRLVNYGGRPLRQITVMDPPSY